MNTATNAAPPYRNFRFFRWLFSWRILRRLLIALAWCGTMVVLFYAEENWRGRRAWNEYRRDLEAKGEQLDFRALIPKAVPDDQNFAATPIIKSWFEKRNAGQSDLWKDSYDKAQWKAPTRKGNKGERKMTDLVSWKNAFEGTGSKLETNRLDREARAEAAPAILQRLNELSILTELRKASSRPYARYPIVWDMENPWSISLPHDGSITPACERLQLRSSAELALGNTDAAMDDVQLMLYLGESLKEEPFVISYLVRAQSFQSAIQPVWEGLLEHRWSEAQLLKLQNQFEHRDFLGDLKVPLEGERAVGILAPELIKKRGLGLLMDFTEVMDTDIGDHGFIDSLVRFSGVIIPSGWYHMEQRNYCRLYQLQLENAVDWKTKRISPKQVQANAKRLEQEIHGGRLGSELRGILKHQLFSRVLLPALDRLIPKAAAAQTSAGQAALACALERYRLAHGNFPETLQSLTPDFMTQLPRDLLTGDLYKYRRHEDGSFLLYSVGWNEKDDGGMTKTPFDLKEGDWIWGRTSVPVPR